MRVCVVGMGLIGGSFAKAMKEYTWHEVVAHDISKAVLNVAKKEDAFDKVCTPAMLKKSDIVLLCLHPDNAIEFINENKGNIRKSAVVIDCCGVKRTICEEMKPIAQKQGFTFIGGHPMAGTQQWGYGAARATLFKGASMILTPYDTIPDELMEKLDRFFREIGFGDIVITTPEDHDRIIAFTSQLPHIISSAYIKSPAAQEHKGFSAGSYKDMTRVAKVNSKLWTQLFLENKDNIVNELDLLIKHLWQYRCVIKCDEGELLYSLLEDANEIKDEMKPGYKNDKD